jgi:hypothetical protein
MTELSLTILSELPEQVEVITIISPKSLCEVDGCYHMANTDKLCKEHQLYSSMQYIVSHKPIESPVAISKYSTEQRGLSCTQMHTDMEELQ